jgi:Stage II sporulation protein E (SpoIIE)
MNSPRLPALLILALLGYGAMFLLFPRIDPAARWNVAIDRDAAIAKARETASRFGTDVQGWRARVTAAYNRSLEYYISKQPDSLAARLLTPVSVEVRLFDYKTKRNIIVELNARGEAIGFRQQDPESRNSSEPAPASSLDQQGSGAGLQQDQKLAEMAVNQTFGQTFAAPPLPALSDTGLSKEGRKFTWTVSDQLLKLTAEVLVRNEHIQRVSLATDFTPLLQTQINDRRGRFIQLLSRADNIVIWPTVILVAIFFFTGLALERVRHRSTLVFLILLFPVLVFTNAFGSLGDANINFSGPSVPGWVERLLILGVFLLINLTLAAAAYFCWAAGLALATRIPERRTIGLELLLKGKILTKPVTNGLLAGLLFGGILSAIPYLVAASNIFPGVELNSEGFEDLFISRSPSLASFNGYGQFFIFVIFSFISSLIGAFIKRRAVARSLLFIVTFLALLAAEAIFISSPALILVAFLETLLFTTIYYRHGLLAVVVAGMASKAMLNSAALFAQPSTSLQHSGRNLLIGLGTFTLVTLVGIWKSREVREDEVAIPPLSTRPDRERLKAELNVARLAQQRMLPDEPPKIDGLDIAAVCQPSKEVGGDLYDFIPLPDGKLAIVVADVSGKGVPASLYMTLTKGLLDSVLEDATDPGEALREVNRHLYEVCRRRVFVTLFLGVIDPAGKTLVYARAGHNPAVYRRASEHTTLVLKSSGIGLGLNSGKIFDTSLKVATLQLESNDTLLFYSDGITEAMNGKNEEYGEERLMTIVNGFDGMKAEDACKLVMADVERFLGSVQPQDDQTMVVVRIN